ncbi:hypothetical protein [Flavobacterium sp. 140616W15]|uniref:hypothetical protein n=1 Tax=Flavobacterium sp. 140616W15 TaxID=2478552 RepID=UPI000F0C0218|nr:hypothetical protein [Flavobacterium sp. 140616W15]AYN04568.1 hypothetical protein EAG11_10630 [Flavobacterium sp. 140616W15]
MEVKNSYIHNSQNINGKHQTWSDRHQGSFANENYKEASMFGNPELPEPKTSQKSIATADEIEEEVEDGDPPKKKRVLEARSSGGARVYFRKIG